MPGNGQKHTLAFIRTVDLPVEFRCKFFLFIASQQPRRFLRNVAFRFSKGVQPFLPDIPHDVRLLYIRLEYHHVSYYSL